MRLMPASDEVGSKLHEPRMASLARGMAPTLYIVSLGRLLRAVDGVPNTARMLEKAHQGSADARAELIAIYLMRAGNPDAIVEAEPEV
jgi:hypothetical protein